MFKVVPPTLVTKMLSTGIGPLAELKAWLPV
jgi:hypothetical protein